MKNAVDLRLQYDNLSQVHWVAKIDVIDGSCDDIAPRMPVRRHGRRHVHQVHHMTAEQFAKRIRLRGQDDFCHLRL